MKKIFLFFVLITLLSAITIYAYYLLYPKNFIEKSTTIKEKIISSNPWLKKYFHDTIKPAIIKNAPNISDKIEYKNNKIQFTNEEIYSPICGNNSEKIDSKPFISCQTCPSYLNKKHSNESFEYISETRGVLLNKENDEAAIFMKGCSSNEKSGSLIIIRKGYGGWQRISVFEDIIVDAPPLAFEDNNGAIFFIARSTTENNNYIKQDLIHLLFNKNELHQEVLFSVKMQRGETCEQSIQASFGKPIKNNNKEFSVHLEILGCQKKNFAGSFKLIYNLKNNKFIPNKESASLITKIEKYGEMK